VSHDHSGVPLRAVVGLGVRTVRSAAGKRQEDVSRAARRWGLNWSRARVWTLESGSKAISAEELILLPLVMSDAIGREVTMKELLPDTRIELSSESTATTGIVLGILAGVSLRDALPEAISPRPIRPTPGRPVRPYPLTLPSFDPSPPKTVDHAQEVIRRIAEMNHRMRELLPPLYDARLWSTLLFVTAPSEAEQAAARRLGEDPRVVLALSRFLFGARSLAEERDARVAARPDAGSDPERLRALRGRETRVLVEQLREHFERHPKDANAEINTDREYDEIIRFMTRTEADRAFDLVLRERTSKPEAAATDDPDVAAAFKPSTDAEEGQ
jgi:hypothetical protein